MFLILAGMATVAVLVGVEAWIMRRPPPNSNPGDGATDGCSGTILPSDFESDSHSQGNGGGEPAGDGGGGGD